MAHHHDHEAHDHPGHDHSHGHAHAPANFGMAFGIGIALNTAFVVLEATYGILANSMALLADAGHNLSDVLALAAAWIAVRLAQKIPTARYTFGLKGATILAAMFNAVFLLVVVGGIAWEAILRLHQPAEVAGKTVIIVAAIGILINGVTAWLFSRGKSDDVNIRGAYLHMLSDALVSLGVVVAGVIMLFTDWHWLDPIVSLIVSALIIYATWSLLTESISMSLQSVPRGIDPIDVRKFLCSQAGVASVHDLHIWAMSTTENAMTAHLLMPKGHPPDSFLLGLAEELKHHHRIGHVTLQVETDPQSGCALMPDDVV